MSIEAVVLNPSVLSTIGESYTRNLSPGVFTNYNHKNRAMGGHYRAGFDVALPFEEMFSFFSSNLGRDVQVYNHRGRGVWEGFIFDMELAMGGFTMRVSFQTMANKIFARYFNGTDTVRSTTYDDLTSQALYGIREQVMGMGESTAALANQAVQVRLARVKDPSIPAISWSGAAAGEAKLSVGCRGYWDMFWWRLYNQTASTGNAPLSEVVEAVVDGVAPWVLTKSIQDNFTGVDQVIDADRWAGDFINSLAALGDGRYNRWVAGMEFGRDFYLRESAQASYPTQ